jgi:hypothetical protein
LSTQLYPEVKDATTLGARFSQPLFLPIGVEGASAVGGTAVEATLYDVSRPADADTLFGAASSLSTLVKFLLGRGVPTVKAISSETDGTAPTLVERQAAWALLESDQSIRLRLTDSVTQADLVALADSAEWAEGIQNKQVAIMGMAAATASAGLITAAGAILSKRGVLVAPGFYDENGVLRGGNYLAAAIAAEVAKNSDLGDDLDTLALAGFTGVEKDANGMPLFRIKAGAGTPINDFETLLVGGVSPVRAGRNGGVEITHLRTTWTTDATFDSLMTRLIVDQIFIDVRNYCEAQNFLRRGNTQKNRDDLKAGVEALLNERSNWIKPLVQPDNTFGYSVAIIPSGDNRSVTISYKGEVVRGIQTILVAPELVIAA